MSFDIDYFEQKWNEHKAEFIRLIQIPSVYDEESVSESCPYGRHVRDALDYMNQLCIEVGMSTRYCDNVALVAGFDAEPHAGSDSCQRIDIVSHLDVVGVDGEWTDNPFSGALRDGMIFGRGTQDMKSGAYLTFLALKLLKENGVKFKNSIRLVYGSDEERTMDDMRRYVSKEGLPDFAFTPDGGFPITIGEKGALMWELKGECNGVVKSFNGGIQPNVIPPVAEATVQGFTLEQANLSIVALKKYGIELDACVSSLSPDMVKIVVQGKAAHASLPDDGDNAVSKLLMIIAELTKDEKYSSLAQCFKDPYGSGAGLDYDIEPMGRLSINPGVFRIADGQIFVQIDCRYPYGIDSKKLTEILQKKLPDYELTLPYDDPPTLVDKDNSYVKLLMDAYEECMGHECKLKISGGVSYSKVFGNCVVFGNVAEESIKLAHQKDECISERDCIKALEIYYRAMQKLVTR